jgi:hypothetical protein
MRSSAIVFLISMIIMSCEDFSSATGQEETNNQFYDDIIKLDSISSVITWIISVGDQKYDGILSVKSGRLYIYRDSIKGIEIQSQTKKMRMFGTMADDSIIQMIKGNSYFDVTSFPNLSLTLNQLKEPSRPNTDTTDVNIKNPTHLVSGKLNYKGEEITLTIPVRLHQQNGKFYCQGRFKLQPNETNQEPELKMGFYLEADDPDKKLTF